MNMQTKIIKILEERIKDTYIEIEMMDDMIKREKSKHYKLKFECCKSTYEWMVRQLKKDLKQIKSIIE